MKKCKAFNLKPKEKIMSRLVTLAAVALFLTACNNMYDTHHGKHSHPEKAATNSAKAHVNHAGKASVSNYMKK